ncbi:hypothetical protein ATO8_07231 [Roseivivax marinus]|uniref:Hedgehog/Intein (Hint) domain-containing protein n=1 Tax=Roseivivax marinus TaxID=1379903 RepID=W4HN13_9RHOB|nr:Hint domain-containing protein [Roseivivax marinus]ETW13803.1 hypothetical protein ATO8_07231 [Roseivivax marinus]
MTTGFQGTFVISWAQTGVDGLEAAPVGSLAVGSAWSWRGEAIRVDGSGPAPTAGWPDGETDMRRRAARMVQGIAGRALDETGGHQGIGGPGPFEDRSFVVTNGVRSYTITLIALSGSLPPLLMFLGEMPPRNTDLWVVHHTLEPAAPAAADPATPGAGGVICFTPGTRIAMADGTTARVEDLREGAMVQTKDSGAQEIRWIGCRRMSGARLFAMPRLRPIRIRAGALGVERPDDEVLVSPDHRIVVRGHVARALFNTPEVLVSARDLVNGDTVVTDVTVKEVSYIHLLLPRHEIVFANNVETESFHPGQSALETLAPSDLARLRALMPGIDHAPHAYGATARRNLTSSEAAILLHEAA